MSSAPDARLRELMASLVGHLHRFVIDHAVTPAEFEAAIAFVTALRQATRPTRNEVVLAVDLLVGRTVHGADGRPLAGAVVGVWQADPKGLYENQDESQPGMNLRGRFVTDGNGRYRLRTVMPDGYPVPTDGPCGALLRAQRRRAFRPAHLHVMVSAPGHRVLVTQVYPDDADDLDSDPVFGVTPALLGRFEPDGGGRRLERDFNLLAGAPVFPQAPIP